MARVRANGEGTMRQRADGTWEGRYTAPDGKQKSIYSKSQGELKTKLNKVIYELEHGIYIEPSKTTLNTWLDTWLNEYKKSSVKPKTYQSYEQIIRLYIKPTIGNKPLMSIKPEQLQKVLNDVSKKGLSPRTVKYIQVVLHGAYAQAVKNNLVFKNVAEAVTLPKSKKKEMRVLTKDEQARFIKGLKGERNEFLFMLDLSTGLRVGELLALRWKDIDLKQGIIKINQNISRIKDYDTVGNKSILVFGTPKTPKSKRSIPLLDDIITLLKFHQIKQKEERLKAGEIWQNYDLVFCSELGTPLESSNLKRDITKAINNDYNTQLEQAIEDKKPVDKIEKIKHFGMHTLRHTFATRALEAGMQPKVVQEILGHSSIALTLDTYSHVLPELKKDSMNLLKDMFAVSN